VEKFYAEQDPGGSYSGCARYGDYRELVARPDLDAVLVCTPDHWHALPAIAAARAGKDIYIEKPITYSVEEGRVLSDTVKRHGRVLQTGTQQRSDARFRRACELVRNGRIGRVEKVEVGCPIDPATGAVNPMPVPPNLDYDLWLGPAPWAPYTEKRVHPQKNYGRPGWLRCSDHTLGMMTGWGTHHVDIAQWGLGEERSGPVSIDGWAEYRDGLWDVHGLWDVRFTYASGVDVHFGDRERYQQGVTFHGRDGRIHVSRSKLTSHPKYLLKERLGANDLHLYKSKHHMGNFVECIKTRAETVAPVEIAHRSCSTCIIGNISSRLGRPLRWDPDRERFLDDDMANRLLTRPLRGPWTL
jgi:predicted dehydrogenase